MGTTLNPGAGIRPHQVVARRNDESLGRQFAEAMALTVGVLVASPPEARPSCDELRTLLDEGRRR